MNLRTQEPHTLSRRYSPHVGARDVTRRLLTRTLNLQIDASLATFIGIANDFAILGHLRL